MLGTSVIDYFFQSNLAGQIIVLILLVFSVMAWGVMFCKKADLTLMETLNAQTAQKVAKSASLIESAGAKSLKGPYAAILRSAVKAWSEVGMGSNESSGDKAARVSYVENAIQRSLSKQVMKYQQKMVLLGTIISGAPFLGLLGTAWGVMDCFGSMSAQTSVTLQNLAPGVAGALLTTVAGLVVAIPSVFGYNYLTAKARDMSVEIENFASLLSDKIELESRTQEPANPPSRLQSAPRIVAEKVVEMPSQAKVINFSLDDDDDDSNSPTPLRDFD